ncbi:MAG: outer membrane beta-barrel protein [Succinivibrio sp.]
MKKSLLVLALASVLSAGAANAAVPGTWTIGASLGYNKGSVTDTDNLSSSFGFIQARASVDDGDLDGYGLKLFGEYNFQSWISAGVGYTYLDSGSMNVLAVAFVPGTTISATGYAKSDVTSHIIEGYAKFNYSLDEQGTELFAKAGPILSFSKIDNMEDDSVTLGCVLGLGGQIALNPNLSIRAGYDYYYNTASFSLKDSSDAKWDDKARVTNSMFYAGVNYTFD